MQLTGIRIRAPITRLKTRAQVLLDYRHYCQRCCLHSVTGWKCYVIKTLLSLLVSSVFLRLCGILNEKSQLFAFGQSRCQCMSWVWPTARRHFPSATLCHTSPSTGPPPRETFWTSSPDTARYNNGFTSVDHVTWNIKYWTSQDSPLGFNVFYCTFMTIDIAASPWRSQDNVWKHME